MTRRKLLLIFCVGVLLTASILAMCILSTPATPPPGVPEGWRHYEEILGRFEVWLPGDWEDLGAIRTIECKVRGIVEGDESPILFVASGSIVDGFPELMIVQDYDTSFEIHAPRVGEELAREFVRLHPIALTGASGKIVYLEPLTDIVTIERNENKVALAYRSYLLVNQGVDQDFVRTIACAVSRNHVYAISLDTIEQRNGKEMPVYGRILRFFRVPQ